MYRLLRVFCGTSWELEDERRAFYGVIGKFNEENGVRAGALYVPVTLTNTPDKRPFQFTVEENIRACRHYILALEEDWGPKERHFERDYRLALECAADPALPMKRTAILLRNRPDGTAPAFAAQLTAAGIAPIGFTGTAGFQEIVFGLLSDWFAAGAAVERSAGAPA